MDSTEARVIALLHQVVERLPHVSPVRRVKLLRLAQVLTAEALLREGSSPKGGDPGRGSMRSTQSPAPSGDTPKLARTGGRRAW